MTTPLMQITKLNKDLNVPEEEWAANLPHIGYTFGRYNHCDKFILGVSEDQVEVFPLEGVAPNHLTEDLLDKEISKYQEEFQLFDHLYFIEYPANSVLEQDAPGHIGKVNLAVAVDLIRDEIDPEGIFSDDPGGPSFS